MSIDPSRAVRRRAVALSLLLALLVFAPPAPGAPQGEPEPPPEDPATPDEPLAEEAAVPEGEPATEESAPQEEPVAPPPAEPPPPPPPSDLELAQATLGHIVQVGQALHSWVRDTRLERDRRPPTGRPPRDVEWERCPPISHADLAALLVPAYLREVPENDSWGRPLEFCLDQRLAASFQQYGVRSAGADGEYESGGYQQGGFAENDLDRDLVWMDNRFVRWPAAE